MSDYESFLASKALVVPCTGIASPPELNAKLKKHQSILTSWALRRGRAAIFADTGLGKGWMILEWARVVAEHTTLPVLILAPLAVSQQFAREAEKLGVVLTVCSSQSDVRPGVNVTNYQKLHKFDAGSFGGVALDEASILKSLDGATRIALIESFRATPFKLSATATPSPNDHTELGGQAEFLGIMKHSEMLATFFINDAGDTKTWRLKGHARVGFWSWVASWGAIVKMPSDIGCPDDGYVLPPLRYHEHVVKADLTMAHKAGFLFTHEAETLGEQRAARRGSLEERVAIAIDIVRKSWPSSKQPSGGEHTTQPIETSVSPTSAPPTPDTEPSASPLGSPRESSARKSKRKPSERTSVLTMKPTASDTAPGVSKPSTSDTDSTGTGSSHFSKGRVGSAQSAESDRTESAASTSTTTTQPEPYEGSCATPATRSSDNTGTTLKNFAPVGDSAPLITSSDRLPKWLIWVDLNAEQDALGEAFGGLAVSIQGTTPDDERIQMESEWRLGSTPILITKPSLFGHGLNWQHCTRVLFVGVSHSFELFFQAIRRCWRFGVEDEVDVHLVTSELEGAVLSNLKDKMRKAEELTGETRQHVAAFVRDAVVSAGRETIEYRPSVKVEWPVWLKSEVA